MKNKRRITGEKRREYTLRRSKRLKHQVGGTIRQSASGIYHVLFDIGDMTYSAYCFAESGQWRLFWPYPSNVIPGNRDQTKKTFKSQNKLIEHIRSLKYQAEEEAGCR